LWGDTVRLTRRIDSDEGGTSIVVTRPVYDRVRDLVPFGAPTHMDVQGIGSVELFAVIDEGVA
jgi:class 3 adenylate cyclase